MNGFLKATSDLINLLYPDLCIHCSKHLTKTEPVLCYACHSKLAFTNYEHIEDNRLERLFWGRVNIYEAMAMCYFETGNVIQGLMHNLKYKGDQKLGVELGRMLGERLLRSKRAFKNAHCIIPLPLHKRKRALRGFNQTECIGEGISEVLKIPLNTKCIRRKIDNPSQTRKSRYQRWNNVKNVFELDAIDKLDGAHVLLLDDTVTTGATLESCARTLQRRNIKISIIAIGIV